MSTADHSANSPQGARSTDETAAPVIELLDAIRPQRAILSPAGATVGSAPDNAIIIQGPDVARYHARITWDGQQVMVTDLYTAGGTYLDGALLPTQRPQPWSPQTPLRIGAYQLRLIQPLGTSSTLNSAPGAGELALAVEAGRERLQLIPGDPVTVRVTVTNRSAVAQIVRARLEGVPAEWVELSPAEQRLAPGAAGVMTLRVLAPRDSASRAGERLATLVATGVSASGRRDLYCQVLAFAEHGLAIVPARQHVVNEQVAAYQVQLHNAGNVAVIYRLRLDSDDQDLDITLPRTSVQLEPGEQASLTLRARPRPGLGLRERNFRFGIEAAPSFGQPLAANAQLTRHWRIPLWVVPAALGALLLLLLLINTALQPTDDPIAGIQEGDDTTVVPSASTDTITPTVTISSTQELATQTAFAALLGTTNAVLNGTSTSQAQTALAIEQTSSALAERVAEITADAAGGGTSPEGSSGGDSSNSAETNSDSGVAGGSTDSTNPSANAPGSKDTGTSDIQPAPAPTVVPTQVPTLTPPPTSTPIPTPTLTPSATSTPEPPTLQVSDVQVSEDSPELRFVFTLSAAVNQTVVFYAQTLDQTADKFDYDTVSRDIVFAPGEVSQDFIVKIRQDSIDEVDETFVVQLSNPRNVRFGRSQAIGSILDIDPPSVLSVQTLSTTSVQEGTGITITLKLSSLSAKTVVVSYNTVDITAKAGIDYLSQNGSLTLLPGTTFYNIAIPTLKRPTAGGERTFQFAIVSVTNAVVADASQVVLVIKDSDTPGFNVTGLDNTELLRLEEPGAPERKDTATFAIALKSEPTEEVTVDLEVKGEAHISVEPRQLVFAPSNWDVEQVVTVRAIDDQIDVAIDAQMATVVLKAAKSDDKKYNGINIKDVAVEVTDKNVAQIILEPLSDLVNDKLVTDENGGLAQFTVRLTTKTIKKVEVIFTVSDNKEGCFVIENEDDSGNPCRVNKDTFTYDGCLVDIVGRNCDKYRVTFDPDKSPEEQEFVITIAGVADGKVDTDVEYNVMVGLSKASDNVYLNKYPEAFAMDKKIQNKNVDLNQP